MCFKTFNCSPLISNIFSHLLVPILVWASLYLPTDDPVITSVLIVLFGGLGFGSIFSLVRPVPPLFGMLIFGLIYKNAMTHYVPPKYFSTIEPHLSSLLRQLALIVILIRAGIGLDPSALMKLKGVVLRLAFSPCLAEAGTIAVASYLILGFPWLWGLMLGFVLAAVSPAVIVPSLLCLRDRGYGVAKGIPTIVIAASSMDDILAISAFGLVLGLNFGGHAAHWGEDEGWLKMIIQGPLEIGVGIGFGLLWGGLVGVFFANKTTSSLIRGILLLGGGIVAVFGFQRLELAGAGPLGCLASSFVAAFFWRRKKVLSENEDDVVTKGFSGLWYIFQPLLFGLIGCEIDLYGLDKKVVALGTICLVIGLAIRMLVTYVAVLGAGLNLKERLFVTIAWIPKATVQAAIGPIALDTARSLKLGAEAEELGMKVLTIAVLVILITAPIGAAAVNLTGPRLLIAAPLLNKTDEKSVDVGKSNDEFLPLEAA